eukprot:15454135-Alexandrium_andersonii.AAC.1
MTRRTRRALRRRAPSRTRRRRQAPSVARRIPSRSWWAVTPFNSRRRPRLSGEHTIQSLGRPRVLRLLRGSSRVSGLGRDARVNARLAL